MTAANPAPTQPTTGGSVAGNITLGLILTGITWEVSKQTWPDWTPTPYIVMGITMFWGVIGQLLTAWLQAKGINVTKFIPGMGSIFVLIAGLLASCAPVISNQPATELPAPINSDLTDTQYNLNQAVAIGALPANDPANACVNAVLPAPPSTGGTAQSFQSKVGGVLSEGSVLYILAQQTGNAVSLTQSPACQQLIGKFVIDGINKAAGPLSIVGKFLAKAPPKP